MFGLDLRGAGQRGDRPRDAGHANPAATRERQPVDGVREQLGRVLRATRERRRANALAPRRPAPARRSTRSPGAAASSAARGRGIATARSNRSRSARESFSRYAASRCARAAALDCRVAAAAARAHVHRPDELEPRREDRVPADAGDRDDAVLERLPERLEDGARELGQLVEQQHAAVRERDLAGPRRRAASDDRRRGRSVMRRAKRRDGDERPTVRKQAGDRVDPRHLERLLPRERREDPRKPPREHRLPRSGRAGEAGGCAAPAAAISSARRARS